MADQNGGLLFVATRGAAVVLGLAATGLAVYTAVLVYAAMTFQHDSLPGPVVLYVVAIGVGLAAILFGGLARVLWRTGQRPAGR